MAISRRELSEMNDLVGKGMTIAQLAQDYPDYDYWEIYWQVNDASFLGKKRTITNRLKKLVTCRSRPEREALAEEAQALLEELYRTLKGNSKKLIEIDRILRK